MELFKAHRQWAKRPDDERFANLGALYAACKEYAGQARVKEVKYRELQVCPSGEEIALMGQKFSPGFMLTHWGFGQLAQRVGAPASYLRLLPAPLAASNLNYGLAAMADKEKTAQLLFHSNGSLLLRALTSNQYERIWNWEVAERLLDLEVKGWEPAVPDVNSLGVDKQTALYASDHDMFAFLRQKNAIIEEPGKVDAPIYRGVIVENSEVGAAALKLTRFLYNCMCGNHIIWGASEVVELSVRHVGEARERWARFAVQCREWANESANEEKGMIARAKGRVIAASKVEVLDAIFGKRAVGLSRKVLEAGYQAVVPAQDGPANTVWGMVQGLTRHSQTIPHADVRMAVDKAAGKLLEVEF